MLDRCNIFHQQKCYTSSNEKIHFNCHLLYSGKIWRGLNLAKCRFFYIGGFLIWRYRHRAPPGACTRTYWRSFNLAVFTRNRQFAKLNPPPNFSAIRYISSQLGTKYVYTLIRVCCANGKAQDYNHLLYPLYN